MSCGGTTTGIKQWPWNVFFLPNEDTEAAKGMVPNVQVTFVYTSSAGCLNKTCRGPDAPVWACGYCANCHKGAGCFG